MKTTGRENAKWDIEKEAKTKTSWVNMIDWKEIMPLMSFSSEYPKGTPTTSRTVCYAQHFNRIFEQIQMKQKYRFKTTSEILRCAIGIGTYILYKLFVIDEGKNENTEGKFFFDALVSMEQIMNIAQIVSITEDRYRQVKEEISKGSLTRIQGEAAMRHLLDSIPEKYKEHVSSCLIGEDYQFRKSPNDFKMLLSGIPMGGAENE